MKALEVLGKIIGNKYVLWALIIAGVVSVIKINSCQRQGYEDRLATYERQLKGQLSDKERELQEMNTQLGLSKSELVTQAELAKRLAKEKQELDSEFKAFVKKHELEIKSKDDTIAQLQQQINGGNSGTDIIGCDELKEKIRTCTISYTWEETLGRFKLKDPNIFVQNDEVFNTNQVFKLHGEIWQQKEGSLQVRRLVLREVHKTGENTYEDIPNAKADIVDSEFVYSNAPFEEPTWKDMFRPHAIALGTVNLYPHAGKTLFGVGLEFFKYKGFGINTHLAFDFKKIMESEWRLGVAYQPKIFNTKLNFAIGLAAGTPFNEFFKSYSASANLIFYLHE
jgi:hypothetical protein